MENNYRIRTDVGTNGKINVNLQQNYDFLEILSLKLSQEDLYDSDNSNHGIIVGRVLANDAFGIPNAKISVFIPIDDADSDNNEIKNLYSYTSTTDTNKNNIRYNLLPDDSEDICYRVVGTFPNKRLMLDDSSVLEVFDKYYKYTTVTNNAGDYMIHGVPTGSTELHIDIDLSDIGVLSQKPRDFMYKGYSETQFDSPMQFKDGTNLDNLSQIISQNQSVYIYPFFGEEGSEDVAITRCDVQIQYKFEPTCVFFGSVVTDSYSHAIGHTCSSNSNQGKMSELVTGEGTIEMIRKTIDGLIEQYQIQGNRLIDSDGVFCYQIPMNLDYVGTDEYGNIVPTDNPNKGIATRTRVRFRFSLEETSSDAVSRHRAKYLVPNNPKIMMDKNKPMLEKGKNFNKHYNFGSNTLEEDFRDLYWNKVYSIKNYIPRFQTDAQVNTHNYLGLRTTNEYGSNNPIPYNKARFRIPFMFMLLCIIIKIVILFITAYNAMVCPLASIFSSIAKIIPKWLGKSFFKKIASVFECIAFGGGLTDSDRNLNYHPGCWCKIWSKDCPESTGGNCKQVQGDVDDIFDVVEEALAQEYSIVHLDFYNDWLNGCLYLPLWHWRIRKKKSFFFGLFRRKAINSYCDCDKQWKRLRVMDTCTLPVGGAKNNKDNKVDKKSNKVLTNWGVIKNVENKDGLNLYYYSSGVIPSPDGYEQDSEVDFVRLFATDIILLGSFNDCDTEGMPQPYNNLPSTTCNLTNIASVIYNETEEEDDEDKKNTSEVQNTTEITGMDWLHDPDESNWRNGLFFGIDCTDVETKPKTCINLGRISELGVALDTSFNEATTEGNVVVVADGLINKIELEDYETRSMFATLNHNGLDKLKTDKATSYKIYDLHYIYPINFDGQFNDNLMKAYGVRTYKDNEDSDYTLFRYGRRGDAIRYEGNNYFPLYNNSFYFYFGLNDGKTAINKFRKKYIANCFKNEKYPFQIDIDKEIPKSCPLPNFNDYGIIDIDLPNIKKPYSYKLYERTTNTLIISENGITVPRLIIGANLIGPQQYETVDESGINTYKSNDGKYYVKDNKIHTIIDGEVIKDDEGNDIILSQYVYKIIITDVNHESQTINVTLMQNPISLNYEKSAYGTEYVISDPTMKTYVEENEYYSDIHIFGVTIDNMDFVINSISETDVDDIYDLEVSKTYDNGDVRSYKVHMTLTIKNTLFDSEEDENINKPLSGLSLSDVCLLNESGKYFELINNELIIKVWIPCTINVKLEQYCNDELIENVSTTSIVVDNGKLFDVLLNTVPMRFIDDTSELNDEDFIASMLRVNLSDGYVYYENEQYIFNKTNGFYNFPSIHNQQIWSRYIKEYSMNDDDNVDYVTKIYEIYYKIKWIEELTKSVFFTDNGSNHFQLKVNGGKNADTQIQHPSYSNFDENIIIGIVNTDTDIKVNSVVACDASHPNIISNNYKNYDNKNDVYIPLLNGMNKGFTPLIYPSIMYANAKHNYLAAFTNHGATQGYEKCEKIPVNAQPIIDEQNNSLMEATSTAFVNNTKFYKADFVDKRLSYIGNVFLSDTPRYHFIFTNGNFIGYDINDKNKTNPNIITPIEDNESGSTESGVTTEYIYHLDEIFDDNSDALVYNNLNARRLLLEAKVNEYDVRFAIINKNIIDGYNNGWWDINVPNSDISAVTEDDFMMLNDDFEYPSKRLLDIKGKNLISVINPFYSKIKFVTCSYDTDTYINFDTEIPQVESRTALDEEINIRFGVSNTVKIGGDLANCAENGCASVYLFGDDDLIFNPKYGRLNIKYTKDLYMDGLDFTPYVPLYKDISDVDDVEELITVLENIILNGDYKSLLDYGFNAAIIREKPEGITTNADLLLQDNEQNVLMVSTDEEEIRNTSFGVGEMKTFSLFNLNPPLIWFSSSGGYSPLEFSDLDNKKIMIVSGRRCHDENVDEILEKRLNIYDFRTIIDTDTKFYLTYDNNSIEIDENGNGVIKNFELNKEVMIDESGSTKPINTILVKVWYGVERSENISTYNFYDKTLSFSIDDYSSILKNVILQCFFEDNSIIYTFACEVDSINKKITPFNLERND